MGIYKKQYFVVLVSSMLDHFRSAIPLEFSHKFYIFQKYNIQKYTEKKNGILNIAVFMT